jgi:hypothetical protein
MSSIHDLSGLLLWRYSQQPASPTDAAAAFPFPGNKASYTGISPMPAHLDADVSLAGEFSQQAYFVPHHGTIRKPPQPEGAATAILAQTRSLFLEGHRNSTSEIERLKTMYRFKNAEDVQSFLSNHRSATSILIDALPQLQKWFGNDVAFVLETTREDNEQAILYAVTIWRGAAEGAVAALEHFDESWWLDQPTQGLALTFTYELA